MNEMTNSHILVHEFAYFEPTSVEQVIAANPTEGFDEQYGDPARLIDRAYMSLSR